MSEIIDSIRSENFATRLWIICFVGILLLITLLGILCLIFGSYRLGFMWEDGVNNVFTYYAPIAFVVATSPLYVLGALTKIRLGQSTMLESIKGFVWIASVGLGLYIGASHLFLLRGIIPFVSLATNNGPSIKSTYIFMEDQRVWRSQNYRELELKSDSGQKYIYALWLKKSEDENFRINEKICLHVSKSLLGANVSKIERGSCGLGKI